MLWRQKLKYLGGEEKGPIRWSPQSQTRCRCKTTIPLVSEPGGEYVTHVTPSGSTGKEIAKEIVSVVRERNVKLRVLGMDGCSTNCGIHKGVFRCVEVELGEAVQHVVCLLHCNELFFRHVFEEIDGVTLGPEKLEGLSVRTSGWNL